MNAGSWSALEEGAGEPLVLLHGIGMSYQAWWPVMPALSRQRRVIAFDLPGFGATAPLPVGVAPTPAALAAALVEELERRRIPLPVDVAGNSLGGFVAFEMAKAGHARSVVGLSPAGLWRRRAPLASGPSLQLNYLLTRRAPRLTRAVLSTSIGRTAGLRVTASARGSRLPVEVALEAASTFGASPGFHTTLRALRAPLLDGDKIRVPITVAFGARDLLLTRAARAPERLPPHTRWITLPGCGHVPMWDDPALVSRVVLEGTGERILA
jgi:pimeloyl-ACP methyl ester carboxylesterase